MNPGDFLKNLSLETWYKVFIVVGAALFAVGLFVEVHGITNAQLELFSAGLFFLGIGEWKNHKRESYIKPPNAYTGPAALIEYTVRKPDLLGLLFDLIGIVLIIAGIISIIAGGQNAAALPVLTSTPTATSSPTFTPSQTIQITQSPIP
jgi:hypothetical protein